MTGFSDLFKIPTGTGPHSPAPAVANWKRPADILEGNLLHRQPAQLERAEPQTERSETTRSETTGPVSTFPVPTGYRGGDQRHRTTPIETGGTVSTPPEPRYAAVDWGGSPQLRDIDTFPSVTGLSDTGPPDSFPLQRKLQIREAKLVQEGHTYGEQTVYEALWKHGTVVNESIRLITIGFLRMASIAGLAESNCKPAVAGLLEKLAIERLPDKNLSQGRNYRVYSWTAVLGRRRAAGLTHVIKSRGVVFVDPKTGQQLTLAKTLPRRPSQPSGPETSGPVSVVSSRTVSGQQMTQPPPAVPSTLQVGSRNNRGVQQSSFLPMIVTDLASRLRNDLDPSFDDSAAGRLWRECHNSVPDCTIDEILHFVVMKAQKIYRDRSIRNPIGLLLMSIPEFFTGSAVHELREQKGREEQQRREVQEQQRKYWKDVAEDSNTPADERELALKFIAEMD